VLSEASDVSAREAPLLNALNNLNLEAKRHMQAQGERQKQALAKDKRVEIDRKLKGTCLSELLSACLRASTRGTLKKCALCTALSVFEKFPSHHFDQPQTVSARRHDSMGYAPTRFSPNPKAWKMLQIEQSDQLILRISSTLTRGGLNNITITCQVRGHELRKANCESERKEKHSREDSPLCPWPIGSIKSGSPGRYTWE